MTHAWLVPAAGALGCLFTYLIWRAVEYGHIHDVPNERSMHTGPLAIGAGWAIVVTVAVLWPWTSTLPVGRLVLILGTTLVLAAISWLDDLRTLPPLWRLLAQACAVGICLWQLPADAVVLGGIAPRWLDRSITGLGWLWFINLYNFMDGIDGLTGTETICIAFGYVVVGLLAATTPAVTDAPLALILVGAASGFLVWNWSPARIILGDVGSIPMGFLLGWLMLDLAVRGHLAAALILPLHHIADATFTLIKRFLTVSEPWRPHRQHFYQKAVLRGVPVPRVVLRIAALDAQLICLAILSLTWPWLALALAGMTTGLLLWHLDGRAPKTASLHGVRRPD